MNSFIKFRSKIKDFVEPHQEIITRIWAFLCMFIALTTLNSSLGYQKLLAHWYVALAIALISTFLQSKLRTVILMGVTIIHLTSLSLQLALIGLAICVVGYLVMAYFRSVNSYNMVYMPVCYQLHVPFAMPLAAGLLKNVNELASVLYGGFITYFLHAVKTNAAEILDESSDISAISVLRDGVLKDKMFYYYMIAIAIMFFIIYFVRQIQIDLSWLIAIVGGIVVEFIIMLAGCLSTGNKSMIGWLLVGNLILLIVGVFLNYFFLDLDYSRIEKVQFEDDDYYYYVTAVPKIRIAAEDKKVKKI